MKSILMSLLAATSLLAQSPTPNPNIPVFKIADGSSSGTYKAFADEIAGLTSDIIQFQEIPSSGAVENLDLLLNNKVSAAFMHSDVIYFRAQSMSQEKISQYKTLLALFKEEVHFITLAQSKKTTGSFWNKKPLEISNIDDLKGLKVGAAGGGFITSQVIKLMTNIPYEVVQFNSGKDVIPALNRGEIDAAVFVGGAPLPNLVDLGPEYKILPIPDRDVSLLQQVYTPAKVTYTKMSPEAVNTVAADCLFVAREYKKTPRLIQLLKTFRTTFYDKLGELQETPGLHPKWQEVDPNNHGKWQWMELN
jgi:hypothetical protein